MPKSHLIAAAAAIISITSAGAASAQQAATPGQGPRTRLLPIGGDAFIMESDPSTRVKYAVVNGRATTMEVIRGDGSRQKHPRSK